MSCAILTRLKKNDRSFIAFARLNDKREFTDFQLFNEETESLLNGIYVARVSRVLAGINAAFVTIAPDCNCYLPFANIVSPIYTNKKSKREGICAGDELLVQVVKDALKTKDPVVSTQLTLYGEHILLTSHNTGIGISKKIPDSKRQELKSLLTDKLAPDRDYGLIVRTHAAQLSTEELDQELDGLILEYMELKKKAEFSTLYTRLYESCPEYILKLRGMDFSQEVSLLTDQEDIYNSIKDDFPVSLHDDSAISLQILYRFQRNFDRITNSVVWLDCGANIIIEQLETLTVIDVNTSKNSTQKADSILQTNLEAAREIALQLRLRNISGMIIIDFINMKSKEDEELVTQTLKSCIKKDSIPCRYIDMTGLGLVELTRKKQYKSLKEILSKKA